jgi:hypothetical protein
MRSVSWAKGTVSGIDPGALESDVSSTTTCITAGAKMNVRAFADRSSQFYGYASLDLGIATSDVEPGKKKFVYNFRGDLPVFPTHLLGDAMMSARLYVSLGDMAHRTVVDPNGEGFLGVALEFQPNSNMFIKPYLAQTSMNGIVGSKYSNTENQKLFQTNSSILGISFGYTTPNEKFSLVLNGSITFAKGFNRTEEGTTKNDAVSFSIKFIP